MSVTFQGLIEIGGSFFFFLAVSTVPDNLEKLNGHYLLLPPSGQHEDALFRREDIPLLCQPNQGCQTFLTKLTKMKRNNARPG
jgi:hypothetical protein